MRPTLSLHSFAQHIFNRIDDKDFIAPVFCQTVDTLAPYSWQPQGPLSHNQYGPISQGMRPSSPTTPEYVHAFVPGENCRSPPNSGTHITDLHATLGQIRPGLRLTSAEPPNPSVHLRGNPQNPNTTRRSKSISISKMPPRRDDAPHHWHAAASPRAAIRSGTATVATASRSHPSDYVGSQLQKQLCTRAASCSPRGACTRYQQPHIRTGHGHPAKASGL